MAASELDDSRTADVEYSIITDGSEDRSAAEYFSIDPSTGVISTKAPLLERGSHASVFLKTIDDVNL